MPEKTHFYIVTIPDLQRVNRYKIGVTSKSVDDLVSQFKRYYPDYILKLYMRIDDPVILKDQIKNYFITRCIKDRDSGEYSDCLSVKYRKLGKYILKQYKEDYLFCSSVVRKYYNLIRSGSIKFRDIYLDYKTRCSESGKKRRCTSFVQLVLQIDYDVKFKE